MAAAAASVQLLLHPLQRYWQAQHPNALLMVALLYCEDEVCHLLLGCQLCTACCCSGVVCPTMHRTSEYFCGPVHAWSEPAAGTVCNISAAAKGVHIQHGLPTLLLALV